MVYKRLRGGLSLNKNLLSTPSPLPGCYVSMTLGPAHKCCFKQDFEFSRRVTVIFRFELYTVAYKLKLPAKYGESCFTRFNFFEIRSESLNKSAMSCCSFLVEIAYTVSQETIHGFQQIRCRGANNHHCCEGND